MNPLAFIIAVFNWPATAGLVKVTLFSVLEVLKIFKNLLDKH